MQFQWLTQSHHSKGSVIFGGWGIGPAPFEHCVQNISDTDILFVDDYRDLTSPLPDLAAYPTKWLLAWSYGVVSFAHWQNAHRQSPITFDRKVAINGTLFPRHATNGISPKIFDATAQGLSEQSFDQFQTHAHGRAKQRPVTFNTAQRQSELWAIKSRGDAPDPAFDTVWISDADRIIPTRNQNRAWTDHPNVRHLDAPHVPFATLTSLDDLFA